MKRHIAQILGMLDRKTTFVMGAFAALVLFLVTQDGTSVAAAAPFFMVGALPPHSGSGSMDLGSSAAFNKREDISELLAASLALENTIAGLLPIGEPFADPDAARWDEDSLNIFQVTDNTAGGQNATDATSTLQLSAGQGTPTMNGTVLIDEGQVLGLTGLEYVQVVNVVGDVLTVTRGFGGSTKVTHAALATWRMIGALLPENSDLDKDISKPRIANFNRIARFGLNVNISDEQLQRALAGYAPGIANEFDYQLAQRVREIKRHINNALIFGKKSSASGDYSMFDGVVNWLTGSGVDQASAAFVPDQVNGVYSTVFNGGGDPDWLMVGTTIARKIANLYSDRIRIEQSERTRGWSVIYFDTDLGKTLRLILDAYFPAQAFALLDSRRLALRPFINSFLYYRTAESFRDGEAARVISKLSLEVRNTQTVAAGGAGLAHQLSVKST